VIGRRATYMMYLGFGAALYVLLAFVGSQSTAIFVIIACVIISYYGGGFATVPAYLKDEFGTLEVGAIHGRLLTAWAAAGVVGPLIVNGILDAAGEPGSLVADDYYPALITMTVLLVVGFAANLMIRPVDSKHYDDDAVQQAEKWADEDRSVVAGGGR
jgi:MFS family permease